MRPHLWGAAWLASALVGVGLVVAGLVAVSLDAASGRAGTIKVTAGATWIERAGIRTSVVVGDGVREADVLVTSRDGALGVVFIDEMIVALGPNSRLGIEQYSYDPTTRQGSLNAVLLVGTMSMSTGVMAKTKPDAVQVRTPRAMLRVRGTDVVIRAGD